MVKMQIRQQNSWMEKWLFWFWYWNEYEIRITTIRLKINYSWRCTKISADQLASMTDQIEAARTSTKQKFASSSDPIVWIRLFSLSLSFAFHFIQRQVHEHVQNLECFRVAGAHCTLIHWYWLIGSILIVDDLQYVDRQTNANIHHWKKTWLYNRCTQCALF